MNAADPKREEQRARQHSRFGKQCDAQAHRQRRAGDVDQFVRRRFEGEGRIEFGPVAENFGPARPHHRRNAGHRRGQQRRHEQRPDRPVLIGGDEQHREGDHRNDRRRHDHPGLAEAVDQPRDLRRNDGVGQREGRRRRRRPASTRHASATAWRRCRSAPWPSAAARRSRRPRSLLRPAPEDFAIGVGHGSAPRHLQSANLHTWRMMF